MEGRARCAGDLAKAEDILDCRPFYGLEEVKERILEYLAVQKRVKKLGSLVLVAWWGRRRGQDSCG
ncbi:hypothetical protein P4123_19970 [Pseudomonas aeruginosa]|nr:hypothetical protein [Pseudomonas aeruginosa]